MSELSLQMSPQQQIRWPRIGLTAGAVTMVASIIWLGWTISGGYRKAFASIGEGGVASNSSELSFTIDQILVDSFVGFSVLAFGLLLLIVSGVAMARRKKNLQVP
jgi:hypothetical protein